MLSFKHAAGISVWIVDLKRADLHALGTRVLSVPEIQRAKRFRFEIDRERYYAAHGAMRYLLGQALECDPKSVEIEIGTFGKPCLAATHQYRPHFNLSHSADLGLVAISPVEAVGVDLEEARPQDFAALSPHFMSPYELARFAALRTAQYANFFYSLWTAKEATLKALGTGLSRDAREVTIAAIEEYLVSSETVVAEPIGM